MAQEHVTIDLEVGEAIHRGRTYVAEARATIGGWTSAAQLGGGRTAREAQAYAACKALRACDDRILVSGL
jgi:hypothetical protein